MLSQTGKRSALKAHRDELKEIEQEIARYKANLQRSAMRKKMKQTAAKSITSVFIDTKTDISQATASLTSPARSKKTPKGLRTRPTNHATPPASPASTILNVSNTTANQSTLRKSRGVSKLPQTEEEVVAYDNRSKLARPKAAMEERHEVVRAVEDDAAEVAHHEEKEFDFDAVRASLDNVERLMASPKSRVEDATGRKEMNYYEEEEVEEEEEEDIDMLESEPVDTPDSIGQQKIWDDEEDEGEEEQVVEEEIKTTPTRGVRLDIGFNEDEEEVVNTPTTPEQNMALEWYHHQVNEIFQKLTPSKNQHENLKQENLIQQEEEEEEEDKQASFSEIEPDQKEMHVPTTETEDTLNNTNNNNDAVSISSSTSDLEPTALMNQMLCEGVDVIDSFDRQLYSNNGFFPNVELQSETATPISKSMESSEHGVVAPLHWSAKKTPGKFGKVYWANEMTGETHYVRSKN